MYKEAFGNFPPSCLFSRSSSSSGILLGSLLLPLAIISTTQSTSGDDDDYVLAVPCLIFSIACLLCVWFTRCKMSVTVLEELISIRWVVMWILVLVVLHRVPLHGVVAVAVSFGGSVTCK